MKKLDIHKFYYKYETQDFEQAVISYYNIPFFVWNENVFNFEQDEIFRECLTKITGETDWSFTKINNYLYKFIGNKC